MAKPFFRETRAVQKCTVFGDAPCLKLSVNGYTIEKISRPLRALQGRRIFGVAIQICVDNRDFEQALRFAAIFSLNFVLYAEIYGCGLSSGACQLPLRPGRLRQVSFCSSRILALVRKSRTSASGR